jgi:hypothetical protein
LEKDLDTKWYNALKDVNSAILGFILKKLTVISTWTGKEAASGAQDYFNSIADASLSG